MSIQSRIEKHLKSSDQHAVRAKQYEGLKHDIAALDRMKIMLFDRMLVLARGSMTHNEWLEFKTHHRYPTLHPLCELVDGKWEEA